MGYIPEAFGKESNLVVGSLLQKLRFCSHIFIRTFVIELVTFFAVWRRITACLLHNAHVPHELFLIPVRFLINA